MLCEKCKKKEATVFYEEAINGKTRSYSLCADCADAMEQSGEIDLHKGLGNSLFGSSSFGSITDDLFGGLFGIPENTRTSQKICPLCHASLENFKRSGKAGCPECYQTFADELRGTIRSIHGNIKHVGRAPKGTEKQGEGNTRLEKLKADLKTAIAEENFEKAAELRDSIRAIETEG